MKTYSAIVLTLFIASIVCSHAIASPTLPAVALSNYSERLSKDVPVSGRVLIGVTVSAGNRSKISESPVLLWAPPAKSTSSLCVSSVSRDGQFYSEGTLSTAALPTNQSLVRVSDSKSRDAKKFVSGLAKDAMATLAIAGECGNAAAANSGPPIVYLTDQMAESNESPTEIQLFINSGRLSTNVSFSDKAGTRGIAQCVQPQDGRRTAFDLVCVFRPTAPRSGQPIDVTIERHQYERVATPVQFQVIW